MAKTLYDVTIIQTSKDSTKRISFYNLKKVKINFNPKTKQLKLSGTGKNGEVIKNEYADIVSVEKTKSSK